MNEEAKRTSNIQHRTSNFKEQKKKCVSMWVSEFENLVGVHGFSVS
jgi:hypothetical protein